MTNDLELSDADYVLSMIDETFASVPQIKAHHERIRKIADSLRARQAPAPVEVSRLAEEPAWMTAFDEARDAILNDRGPLEGQGLANDQTNAVLAILDDSFMPHLRRGPISCDGIAAQVGAVAIRLAKDSGYRHRAAEELLSIQHALASMASTPVGEPSHPQPGAAEFNAEMARAKVPGLGRMTDEDDGYLTLQFVNEAAAAAFMASHEPTVDTRDMPPYRLDPVDEVPAGFAMREIKSELQYIHDCAERWKEDGQARSITIQATVENIRNLLAASPAPAASTVPTMGDALAAGDCTLHGAIDYWQNRALAAEAARDMDETNKVLADNYIKLTAASKGAEAQGPNGPIYSDEEETLIRQLAAPSEPEAQKAVAPAAKVLFRQDEDGLEPVMFYGPGTEPDPSMLKDRFVIRDVWLSSPAASMEVQGLTDAELRVAWEAGEETGYLEWAAVVTRALAAKNGWRLGEVQ